MPVARLAPRGDLPRFYSAHRAAAATIRGAITLTDRARNREQLLGWALTFHNVGTTRMHPDPARGVVDENCRVHGTSNVFVAGSSVFPTAGWAPPTLTIVALALRLADHLRATSDGREGIGGRSW